MRALARSIAREHRDRWSVDDAMAFADALIADRYLEVKARRHRGASPLSTRVHAARCSADVEALARRRTTRANWATTDAICGTLIGPLLVAHPRARPADARVVDAIATCGFGARRSSRLLPAARQALALDRVLRDRAAAASATSDDLIQKAVGWVLREAGKVDPARLERYLRANGPRHSAHDVPLCDRAVSARRAAPRVARCDAVVNCQRSSLRPARLRNRPISIS